MRRSVGMNSSRANNRAIAIGIQHAAGPHSECHAFQRPACAAGDRGAMLTQVIDGTRYDSLQGTHPLVFSRGEFRF